VRRATGAGVQAETQMDWCRGAVQAVLLAPFWWHCAWYVRRTITPLAPPSTTDCLKAGKYVDVSAYMETLALKLLRVHPSLFSSEYASQSVRAVGRVQRTLCGARQPVNAGPAQILRQLTLERNDRLQVVRVAIARRLQAPRVVGAVVAIDERVL
jgi:hypothetical protein